MDAAWSDPSPLSGDPCSGPPSDSDSPKAQELVTVSTSGDPLPLLLFVCFHSEVKQMKQTRKFNFNRPKCRCPCFVISG